ncbi:MAG: hypothetical protein VST66_07000 [Nitrospirota bacterium]|nr:hypothetical protein [Nitrospirota bacterium]
MPVKLVLAEAGSGHPDFSFSNLCGVSPPHDEVLLFCQKDSKAWPPLVGPAGLGLRVPSESLPHPAAAELASLKQSSPSLRIRLRFSATPAGGQIKTFLCEFPPPQKRRVKEPPHLQ